MRAPRWRLYVGHVYRPRELGADDRRDVLVVGWDEDLVLIEGATVGAVWIARDSLRDHFDRIHPVPSIW